MTKLALPLFRFDLSEQWQRLVSVSIADGQVSIGYMNSANQKHSVQKIINAPLQRFVQDRFCTAVSSMLKTETNKQTNKQTNNNRTVAHKPHPEF